MKSINLLLLFAFLLSSCTPVTTTISTSTSAQTVTPVPTATQTPSPTPTIVPTPTPIGGGSGKVSFTLDKATFEKTFPDLTGDVNFFTSNADGTDLTSITNGLKGTYTIEGVSPDGDKVLVASSGSLYIIDLGSGNTTPSKLARGLYEEYATGHVAKWIDNERIVFFDNGKDGSGIYVINVDGTNLKKIGTPIGRFPGIVSTDKTHVYWDASINETFKDETGSVYTYGEFSALWWANLDGSGSGPLKSNGKQIVTTDWYQYAFSHDGNSIAWIPVEYGPGCHHAFFVAARIRDGEYTKNAGESTALDMIDIEPSDKGKTIDFAYVKDYTRQCFIMYVVSLSDMDNPIKVALMPPDSFFDTDFVFGKYYDLMWWPDGSRIALFYRGFANYSMIGDWYHDSPLLFYAKPTDQEPKLTPLSFFSKELANNILMLDFTPDGQQIRLFDNINNPRARFFDLQKSSFVNDSGNNGNINFENIFSHGRKITFRFCGTGCAG